MNKSIGFFGDSFVASRWSNRPGETTFLELIFKHYNFERVTCVGVGGSSLEDCIILQLMPLFKIGSMPDVCIFSWTDIHRLFHRNLRGTLNGVETIKRALNKTTNLEEKNILNAAKEYYLHLIDTEVNTYRAKALYEWVDNNVFSKLADKKIIHLWSFGINPDISVFPYRWNNGAEIRPSLYEISKLCSFSDDWRINDEGQRVDQRPNHIAYEYNQIPYNWICTAIDNYKNGMLYDYTDQINKMKEEKSCQ